MDRGRDLKVAVLSDVDRFDLDKPADQLEALADAAQDADRQLYDADRQLERTAEATESLGDDAKSAAAQVDSAFDKIAAASKRAARDVDDSTDRADASLRDMGDEGADTAREMAASFDGTASGIQDAFQEAATNVLAVLGPLGAAAGVALGSAIGAARAQTERLQERVSGLVGELIDAGGRLERDSVLSQLRAFAEDGTIQDFADQARRAKVDVSDYLRALAGDPEAMERTRAALAGIAQVTNQRNMMGQVDAANDMRAALDDTATAYGLANAAAQAYAGAAGDSAQATQEFADAATEFVDAGSVYSDALSAKEERERATAEATAAATKSQTDSWEDFAKDVDLSVQEYLAALEETVKAQAEWSTNMQTLAARGVDQGVLAELARLGPEGAPLVAKFATATDAELVKLQDLFAQRAQLSTSDYAAGIVAGAPGVARAGGVVRQSLADQLSVPIDVPIRPYADTTDAARVRRLLAAAVGDVPANVVPKYGNQRFLP